MQTVWVSSRRTKSDNRSFVTFWIVRDVGPTQTCSQQHLQCPKLSTSRSWRSDPSDGLNFMPHLSHAHRLRQHVRILSASNLADFKEACVEGPLEPTRTWLPCAVPCRGPWRWCCRLSHKQAPPTPRLPRPIRQERSTPPHRRDVANASRSHHLPTITPPLIDLRDVRHAAQSEPEETSTTLSEELPR